MFPIFLFMGLSKVNLVSLKSPSFSVKKYQYCLLAVQVVFSGFVLFHAVPASNSDSIYRALALGVLGYWFPSPVSSIVEEDK